MKPLAIGVTGGIGGGKTTVVGIFASIGGHVLYADQMAQKIVNTDDTVRRRIKRQFGDHVYSMNGTLDRKQMARFVFTDPLALDTLNEIVHPSVLRSLEKEIISFKQKEQNCLLFVEAALLFEVEADTMFDYMIVVDAEEEERIRRVMSRDKSARSDVLQRVKTQMPVSEKMARADFVIHNTQDMKVLKEKCRFIYKLLHAIARTS
ncbi:MAG: dephospho-CoA kinase [Ignavibacteriae bacterium]|nr:dephospho-CoA kinase [Ignavibacteria bacterium]MBI3365503.1 dephospho-CoA kinase [Ignavibacteriota bacterium]